MSPFNLEDYVTVAERIERFYAQFPEGSIQTDLLDINDKRVIVRATVYRTAADERPSIAHSAMSIPGTTPYTKGSEIENAETSAVGRAIAMFGFETKKGLASKDEIDAHADHPVAKAEPEHAVADGPWSEGQLTTSGAIFLKASSPGLDGELRHTADGPRLMFGLDLGDNKRIPQVVALGDLAVDIHDAIGNEGRHLSGMPVTVSGELLRVPWEKGGKPMRAFQRLVLARIETPDWTLPAPEVVTPGQEPLSL